MDFLINLVQSLNDALHKEPINFLAERMYWFSIFLILCPLAGVGQLLVLIYDLFLFSIGQYNVMIPLPSTSNKEEQELGIVITGCDSGFGRDLVFDLTSKGFTVFCGCLNKDSFQQFESIKEGNAIPIKMDVTNDKEVKDAYEIVSQWLSATEAVENDKTKTNKKRFLHALINNAGIGSKGLIDWFEMKDVYAVMEVNFFGMVRVTKTFLPLFQIQASTYQYQHQARIINNISVAGMFAGTMLSVLYESSKYASEAFTINLRREMSLFNVKVTSINPGVFETPMYRIMEAEGKGLLVRTWNSLSKAKQDGYGQDFYDELFKAPPPPAWRSEIVINEIVKCVLLKNPPAKVIPGADARFILSVLGKLPVWLSNGMLNIIMGPHTQPAMMIRKKGISEGNEHAKEE